MPLLNLQFAILVIKIAICFLPGVIGFYLIICGEESKRNMRNAVCNALFGVSNAIPSKKFARTLYIVGSLGILFSIIASWFILLLDFSP